MSVARWLYVMQRTRPRDILTDRHFRQIFSPTLIINSGAIRTKHIINVHRPNYIPFVADDFKKAVESAAKGRKKRPEVKEALKDVDGLCASIKQRLKDGSWRKDIEYRKLTKVNNNKKVRHIDAPTFRTLVYEHLLKNKRADKS